MAILSSKATHAWSNPWKTEIRKKTQSIVQGLMLFTLQSSLKSQSNIGGFRNTYNHPNAVLVGFKVARLDFLGLIPPKFEH